ncbi:MAG TPA: tRNA (adenosine(37)-N6)-threonylcarbamoyltransferase complex dimerization subunit type 1 TsaB [Chloroflexota bacterium]
MLLAIDTSTHYASIALHDGARLLAEHTWLANQDHTRTLLPNVQRLLAGANAKLDGLSVIAVALGPGSFNGLRVGLSTAKGLAVARDLPLIGVPTLALLAAEYGLQEVTMNAGRGRVYVWRSGANPHPSPLPEGEGVTLREGSAPDRVRHAGVLAELGWERLRAGQASDPAKLQPLYVQPPHITESRKKSHMQAA